MTTHSPTHAAQAIGADVMVVGAGPAGLFLVFELGLLGLSALVVDPLPEPGGQLQALYPHKPIYDIPALTHCTGQDLTHRLLAQIRPFATQWALGHTVTRFAPHAAGFEVQLSPGQTHHVKALAIAAGVGAFAHRQVACADLNALRGHSVVTPDALGTRDMQGQRVVVAGSDDVALACAEQALQAGALSVHVLHRRETLEASPQALAACAAYPHFSQWVGQITQAKHVEQQLQALCLSRAGHADVWQPAEVLVEALGLVPQLGPLTHWGLAMHKKQIQVNPQHMATSLPGVYAIGDVAHYPGKRRLIVSAFHEATMAAYAIAERLQPGPVPFEYTTASARLQARLGLIQGE